MAKMFKVVLCNDKIYAHEAAYILIKGGCLCFYHAGEATPHMVLARGEWREVRSM